MLTKDLIKPTFRKDKIYPRFLKLTDEKSSQLAEDMLLILQVSSGQSYGEIEDLIDQLPGDQFRTRQAFWHILANECQWKTIEQASIAEQRWQCFHQATALRQSKNFQSLSEYREHIAEDLGVNADALSQRLFSDLPDQRRLEQAANITSQAVVKLYNLAQVQGLLQRAKGIKLKLNGVEQMPSEQTKPSQLLATLLQVEKFTLEAEVHFGAKIGTLCLDEKSPLIAGQGKEIHA